MLVSISETIKSRRKELKLTQPYLAGLADVSANTVYKIESGGANPTIEVLEKIVEILGMKIQLAIKDVHRF